MILMALAPHWSYDRITINAMIAAWRVYMDEEIRALLAGWRNQPSNH